MTGMTKDDWDDERGLAMTGMTRDDWDEWDD